VSIFFRHTMQAARLVARTLLRARAPASRLAVLTHRMATTAVTGEVVTKTPYTRPGYFAQWACMAILFFKNEFLKRVVFLVISYFVASRIFGARFYVDYDVEEAPAAGH